MKSRMRKYVDFIFFIIYSSWAQFMAILLDCKLWCVKYKVCIYLFLISLFSEGLKYNLKVFFHHMLLSNNGQAYSLFWMFWMLVIHLGGGVSLLLSIVRFARMGRTLETYLNRNLVESSMVTRVVQVKIK